MEDELKTFRAEAHRNGLIRDIAELTGESAEEVVLQALEERLARLSGPSSKAERKQHLRNVLETSVWRCAPRGDLGRTRTREEQDEILGYGPEGV